METVCNKLENSIVEVDVTFDTQEWKDAQDKALNKLAKSVKLDGFRKGKAPIKMIKSRIGKAAILEEATDIILNKNYQSILVDNNVQLIAQPEVQVTELNEETLKVKIVCQVFPDVNLVEYKGLEVKKTAVRVTKKEIEERIKDYQNQYAELIVKEDGEVENGDTAVIDFEGFKDGVAFDGGKGENHPLEIGSGSFIPGFEEQLIGMKVNEEREINVTFPEDYHAEDLAGAAVVFKVTVHEIKSKVLPEIDDELAKDVNIDGVETLEDLNTYVKEQIKVQKQTQADREFDEKIYNLLVEKNPIDVPAVMVESEMEYMVREISQNLQSQGITLEQYLDITGTTIDDIKENMKDQAESRVKYNLILAEIVKAEGIEITDEEVEEEINTIASYYGEEELDRVKEILKGQIRQIKEDLANRKAVQLIKDNLK